MFKIITLSEYVHYIDAFIQGQLVMSNCVLPLCEIENKIIEGHVQLAQIDNFLIVLVERECHYDFYYYRKRKGFLAELCPKRDTASSG